MTEHYYGQLPDREIAEVAEVVRSTPGVDHRIRNVSVFSTSKVLVDVGGRGGDAARGGYTVTLQKQHARWRVVHVSGPWEIVTSTT